MAKVYKIHPAIGVARVGNSPDVFFVGPEQPGRPGLDIAAGGTETPVQNYKDGLGNIKRQAARFRIFEYEKAADGKLTLNREITAADAQIVWNVTLANRKAALERTPKSTNPK